jgi:hypothetical protein
LLRGYRLAGSGGKSADGSENKVLLGDEENLLVYYGALKRSAGATQGLGGIEKCSSLHVNSAGTLLAAQSTGKIVEVCSLRIKWSRLGKLVN